MAEPTTLLSGIMQIAITVQDLDRAIAFYKDILGLKFLFKAPPSLAFFDCGGIRLLMSPLEAGQAKAFSTVVYYRVADIQAAARELNAKGASLDLHPKKIADLGKVEVWLAEFKDTEGNSLALMSEVPKA